jgi:gliding motility-associated-like protein
LLALTSFQVKATHIIGGELYYECLGNNQYRIVLKLYRDCFNGIPPFDNPAPIGIFTSSGALVDMDPDIAGPQPLYMYDPVVTNLPPVIANPCLVAPPNICVEEGVYEAVVTLPPINGGYTMVYQRCCRNNTILNIVNPGDVGATYTAFIPGSGPFECNSSPRYNNFPPIVLCINDPLSFDHAATDPDGDSLVYFLCDPYEGGSTSDPAPDPPFAPPYANVIFANPFSATNPLGANPGLAINPQTGLLTGTPNMLGQFVVAVCVGEYRNGQLIAVHKRDFQFNVVNCLSNVAAAFINPNPDPLNSCNGFDIPFDNQSSNAQFFYWDFGVPGITSDTSNEQNPLYSYPAPGVYTVMLIANPGYYCADTAYTTFGVYPLLEAYFDPPTGQCITGNSFDFTAGGSYQNDTQFNWDFSPSGNPLNSQAQNPQNISYPAPGTYGVTVTYIGEGCTRSYTDSIIVYPEPTIDLDISGGNGCEPFPVQFTNNSTASDTPLEYWWDFGDGEFSNEASPLHIYQNDGVYDVTLTAYSLSGCVDTLVLSQQNLITVKPSPTAGFIIDPVETDVLAPWVSVIDQSSGGIYCELYMGIGDTLYNTCSYAMAYQDSGTYYISQIVINEVGCPDTLVKPVRINPIFRFYAPNAFTPNGDIYNDGWRTYGEGIKTFKLYIFNRWGQKVFESDNIFEEWDGTFMNQGGEISQDGVYVYAVYLTDVLDKDHVSRDMVVLIK